MVRLVARAAALAAALAALTVTAAYPPGATATAVARAAAVDNGGGGGLWPRHAVRQADPDADHADEHHKCDSSVCVRNWKLMFIAVLFVEGVLGGFVPYGLQYLPRFDIALHVANSFSGGIFIATGMLHVLPEALELMAGNAHDGEPHEEEPPAGGEEHPDEHEAEFPSVYAYAMASFFVILFVEHLLLRKYASAHGHAALAEVVAEKDVDEFHVPNAPPAPARNDSWDAALGADATSGAVDDDVGGANSPDAQAQAQARNLARMPGGGGGGEARPSYGSDESFELRRQTLAASNGRFFSANFFRALLAIVAVALHSMFESLSLGLASDFSSALSVFIAIAAHKWATSIALGVKCEKEQLRFGQYISLILLFAAVTPLAAGLGLLIAGVDTTVRGTLFALSAGIFLYIGALEVPAEEFMVHSRWLWGKYAAYVSGAIVITVITAILVVTGVH